MKKTLTMHLVLATVWFILLIAGALWTGVLQPSSAVSQWIGTLGEKCGEIVLFLTVVVFIVWLVLFARKLEKRNSRIKDALKIWDGLQPHPSKPDQKIWSHHDALAWRDHAVVIFYYQRRLQRHIANAVKIGLGLTTFGIILVFPVVEQMGSLPQGELLGVLFQSGLGTSLISTFLFVGANVGMGEIEMVSAGHLWESFLDIHSGEKQS